MYCGESPQKAALWFQEFFGSAPHLLVDFSPGIPVNAIDSEWYEEKVIFFKTLKTWELKKYSIETNIETRLMNQFFRHNRTNGMDNDGLLKFSNFPHGPRLNQRRPKAASCTKRDVALLKDPL